MFIFWIFLSYGNNEGDEKRGGYLYGGVGEEAAAEELILLRKSLEEDVENPLCICVASVRQQCHLREHYYYLGRKVQEALTRVLTDDHVCLVQAGLTLLDEGFVLLRVPYEEGCVFKKLS